MNDLKKYEITVGVITRQVYPINDKDITYTHAKEDDRIFYDRKLKNKLIFGNDAKKSIDDFSFIYGYESDPALRCETFRINIFKLCQGVYVLEYAGKFGLTDGEWDLEKCTFMVKPEPDNIYACIKEKKKKEFNILDIPEVITTSTQLLYNYEFFSCVGPGANFGASGTGTPLFIPACTPPGSGWLLLHEEEEMVHKDEDCVEQTINATIYYREYIVTSCVAGTPNPPPSGSGWVLDTNNCATDGTAKWVRTPTVTYDMTVTNYNPSVVWSNCNDTPSQTECLIVEKTDTPNTVVIIGYSSFDSAWVNTGSYSVKEIPGATYSWSITGGGNTIDSGAGTNIIGVTYNNSGSIQVDILTPCGNTITEILNFIGAPSTDNIINGIELHARKRVCAGSKTRLKFNCATGLAGLHITTLGTATVASVVTISSSPYLEYEYEFGPGEGAIAISFLPSGVMSPDNVPSLLVFVTKAPMGVEIKGYTDVCETGQYYYEVPALDSITAYNWSVEGGTIDSGQGTPQIAVTWDGTSGPGKVLLKEVQGCNCSLILVTDYITGLPSCPSFWLCPKSNSDIIYDRNRFFKTVVEYVIEQMDCGITAVVSDFFDWNAIGDAIGYAAGTNYVTAAPNKLTNMTIAQKSDILTPTSSNAATKGMITFEKLEKIWKELFKSYWFIDASDNLRIEHESFFQDVVGYDTTVAPHAVLNVAKRQYLYDKSKMPKYERFKFSEALQTDMIGADIWYDSICVDQNSDSNVKDRGVDFLTSDLYKLFLDPTDVNKVGFVLMCNSVSGGVYVVDAEVGKISGLMVQNGHLSWANLHYNYHRYGRVLLEGYMNNIITTFFTAIRAKQQKNVIIQLCCDEEFEPSKYLIKTELGNGIVDEADHSTRSNIVNATILLL